MRLNKERSILAMKKKNRKKERKYTSYETVRRKEVYYGKGVLAR